jgi:hypothetical protein
MDRVKEIIISHKEYAYKKYVLKQNNKTIADSLKVTETFLNNYTRNYRMNTPFYDSEDKIKCLLSKKSPYEMCKKYGVTYRRFQDHCKKIGIDLPRIGPRKISIEKIKKYVKKYGINKSAIKLQCSESNIKIRLKKEKQK